MASSGTGNSHDSDYRKCQRLFLYRHRHHLAAKSTRTAPPLLVGEALHKYCEIFIDAWINGPIPFAEACEEAMAGFDAVMGTPNPEDTDMLERESLARGVIPLWAARKWQRLESGIEIPIATEVELALDLPADTEYGPIHAALRRYTAKIDYAYQEGTSKFVVISDHKGTKAQAPAKEVKHYMMSDQHVGYVACWNASPFAADGRKAAKVEYSLTRLHPKVTSEHTFWDEPRNIDDTLVQDWYERMLALRADMSAKWDKAAEVWISNRTPHGPCLGMDGRACEFQPLCARPADVAQLIAANYVTQE